METIRILVVEDELLIAMDIQQRLRARGYEVLDPVPSALDAIQCLSQTEIDLCILDINLQGSLDGVSLASQIKEKWDIPIIFLTTYDDDLTIQRATQVGPSAYLIKPFKERELAVSIELAFINYAQKKVPDFHSRELPADSTGSLAFLKDRFFLRSKEKYERVRCEDILWAEAQSNYTEIHTEDSTLVLAITLMSFHEKLNASCFVRIHRSFLINLDHIESILGNTVFIGDKSFPVSKSFRKDFFDRVKLI